MYDVRLTNAAKQMLKKLDTGTQRTVVKQLRKLEQSPTLGDALGRKRGIDLTGYRKLYAANRRIRIIYSIDEEAVVVTVIAIGKREDAAVYQIAAAQIPRMRRLRRVRDEGVS